MGILKTKSGNEISRVGFGTDGIKNANVFLYSLKTGYRLFDTAADYRNEKQLSEAVDTYSKDNPLFKRDDVFIIYKIKATWRSNREASFINNEFDQKFCQQINLISDSISSLDNIKIIPDLKMILNVSEKLNNFTQDFPDILSKHIISEDEKENLKNINILTYELVNKLTKIIEIVSIKKSDNVIIRDSIGEIREYIENIKAVVSVERLIKTAKKASELFGGYIDTIMLHDLNIPGDGLGLAIEKLKPYIGENKIFHYFGVSSPDGVTVSEYDIQVIAKKIQIDIVESAFGTRQFGIKEKLEKNYNSVVAYEDVYQSIAIKYMLSLAKHTKNSEDVQAELNIVHIILTTWKYCIENDITFVGHSLMKSSALPHPLDKDSLCSNKKHYDESGEIIKSYMKFINEAIKITIAKHTKEDNLSEQQCALLWSLLANTIQIPKSTNPDHIRDNLNILGLYDKMGDLKNLSKSECYTKLSEALDETMKNNFKEVINNVDSSDMSELQYKPNW